MTSVLFACSAEHRSRYYGGAGGGIDLSSVCLWVSKGATESKTLSKSVFMSVKS